MSIENLTKLVGELAEVIKFHELETVDSRAAELLYQVEILTNGGNIPGDSEDIVEWIEQVRQANMVETSR